MFRTTDQSFAAYLQFLGHEYLGAVGGDRNLAVYEFEIDDRDADVLMVKFTGSPEKRLLDLFVHTRQIAFRIKRER